MKNQLYGIREEKCCLWRIHQYDKNWKRVKRSILQYIRFLNFQMGRRWYWLAWSSPLLLSLRRWVTKKSKTAWADKLGKKTSCTSRQTANRGVIQKQITRADKLGLKTAHTSRHPTNRWVTEKTKLLEQTS